MRCPNVGGGSVELRAAIQAHDAGAHVLIISRARKQILIQYLQEVVLMQLLGLWIQKIAGGKCKYGLSYPFERNWFTRK